MDRTARIREGGKGGRGARPRESPSPKIADGTACPRFSTLPRGEGNALRLELRGSGNVVANADVIPRPCHAEPDSARSTAGPRDPTAYERGPSRKPHEAAAAG